MPDPVSARKNPVYRFKKVTVQEWYLYMVRCRDGSLYTGIATDVERRFSEHQSNRGAKYLRGRGPLKLVFQERIGAKGRALRAEQQVKKMPRQKKEQLIKTGAGIDPEFTCKSTK